MLRLVIAALLIAALLMARGAHPPDARPADLGEPDSVPDAFAHPMAALVWPGATRSFLIEPDGGLYNGVWRVDVAAGAQGVAAAAPRRIAYEDRWLPVAHWTERAGAVRWDVEAVAAPAPEPALAPLARARDAWFERSADRDAQDERRRTLDDTERTRMDRLVVGASHRMRLGAGEDVPMVVSVLATARNTGVAPVRATLDVTLARARADEPWFEGGARPDPPRWGFGVAGADSAIAWSDGAEAHGTRRALELEPGETATVRWVLASHPLPASRLAAWARTPHAQRVAEARRFWRREIERGTRFDLGDPDVEAAIAAARVVLLSCRERRGGQWVPLGGPFHYRDVWLRDGARAIAALAVHGYTGEARAMAESFLGWQWPHGPFVSQGAQLDGTGQALWALGQTLLRPEPDPDVAHAARAAYDAWRWCERTRHAQPEPGAIPGLLPTANPQDNELVRGQLVGTDAWALAGYTAAARLLRAAGRAADADSVEASRLAYRATFARALAHTGSTDVPPSYAGPGRDWGNLAVGYPCDALPASTPRLAALSDRYWSAAHGRLGYCGSVDSLHGYVAVDLATWAMRAGRRADADLALDALLEWRNASGGGGELFTRGGDFGVNLPPHATSAAALLQLVRNMVVDDDGDRLRLTQGVRASWWRGSHVDRAPTRWGSLWIAFRRRGDEARWSWTPVPVWTELVLPPGTTLATPPPAPLVASPRGDAVLAPPGTTSARVRVSAGRSPSPSLAPPPAPPPAARSARGTESTTRS